MTDPIDISQQVRAICQALDLEPNLVASIHITPGDLAATTYTPNERGRPYIDQATNQAVIETLTFKVTT